MTTIIYHKADADGWMSHVICKKFATGPVTSIGWDYGDPVPEIPAEGEVYMVDICIDDIVGNVKLRDRLIWIDHHKTSLQKWAHIDIRGLRIDGVAACRLCWQWFNDEDHAAGHITVATGWSERLDGEPEGVFLVGLRDVWKHDGTPHQERCNHLNLGIIAIPEHARDSTLADLLTPPEDAHDDEYGDQHRSIQVLQALLERGEVISVYMAVASAEKAARGAMVRSWQGLRFLVLNSAGRGSMVLDAHARKLQDAGINIEALLVWSVDAQGRVSVSLYHAPGQKSIDLSGIARMYGGGGHAGACGCFIGLATLEEIINP